MKVAGMNNSYKIFVGSLFAAFLISSCKADPNQTKLQYVPDMADAPTVKSQENYLDPPEGTVSRNTMVYPDTVEAAEANLVMPGYVQDAELNRGKQMYDTFCIPCHGADAKGPGTIGGALQPPDITTPTFAGRGDGFFFYRITFGSSIMPGYGHATSIDERWHIVKYLRSLQAAH